MPEPLSEDERKTLKLAAFGAVFLVSNADPGFFSMLRESVAASGALVGATGLVKDALSTGPLPSLPRNASEVERMVLPALEASLRILQAKAPDDVDNYRTTVLTATTRVANAAEGIAVAEAEMIQKVRRALGIAE